MDALKLIKTRRSIRKFTKKVIPQKAVQKILEAGRWAPSGLNNQPWRFMVLDGNEKNALSGYTHYNCIVKSADKVILVFLDKKSSYNHEKDLMAIGACIQNMLLFIHSLKLGACWLGEILNKREQIRKLLDLPGNLELSAVIALGYPAVCPKNFKRKPIETLILK